jgi:hypothetical protein
MTRKDWVQKSKHIRRNRMIRMHYGFVWNWSGNISGVRAYVWGIIYLRCCKVYVYLKYSLIYGYL